MHLFQASSGNRVLARVRGCARKEWWVWVCSRGCGDTPFFSDFVPGYSALFLVVGPGSRTFLQ